MPLIIAVPGNDAKGQTCRRPVELVSLQKTLTDLCDIAPASRTEGYSMRPLVENPKAKWKHAAYSQVTRSAKAVVASSTSRGEIMGRSARTERWRYTEWDEGRAGSELYDHDCDPNEMNNVAQDPRHSRIVKEMQVLLRAGGK